MPYALPYLDAAFAASNFCLALVERERARKGHLQLAPEAVAEHEIEILGTFEALTHHYREAGLADDGSAHAALLPAELANAISGVALLRAVAQFQGEAAAWWARFGGMEEEDVVLMETIRTEMAGWDRFLYGKAHEAHAVRLSPWGEDATN